jgi:hypothetical protein
MNYECDGIFLNEIEESDEKGPPVDFFGQY